MGVILVVLFLAVMLLICISPIILINRFLGDRIKNNFTRKLTSIVVAIAMFPIVYRAVIIPWYYGIHFFPTRSFKEEKWRANVHKRYEMAEDLLDGNRLVGKSKTEIMKLLGTDNYSEPIDYKSNEWTYYLGFRPGIFMIYPDELDIKFSEDHVTTVRWSHGNLIPL